MGDLERRAQQVRAEIAAILLHDWDPIGVAGILEAQNEYDSYVGPIYRLLASGASAREVAEHLLRIETIDMGLAAGTAESLSRVAERLAAVDARLQW